MWQMDYSTKNINALYRNLYYQFKSNESYNIRKISLETVKLLMYLSLKKVRLPEVLILRKHFLSDNMCTLSNHATNHARYCMENSIGTGIIFNRTGISFTYFKSQRYDFGLLLDMAYKKSDGTMHGELLMRQLTIREVGRIDTSVAEIIDRLILALEECTFL